MPSQTQPSFLTHGRYSDLVARGIVYSAYSIVTAPVIWSTAAGTGGPLVWNSSVAATGLKRIELLAVGIGTHVVTTVAGSVGVGWGTSTAPSSTTAIDLTENCLAGAADSGMTVIETGTVSAACKGFMPLMNAHTGALTVDNTGMVWYDIGGLIQAPTTGFITLAGSATLSTLVIGATLVWAEIP